MNNLPEVFTDEFLYDLPYEKIAYFPVKQRSDSRLLVLKNNVISETLFSELPNFIDDNSVFVLNNTKVVPARLLFKKDTGATIEILCVEPITPSIYFDSLNAKSQCSWLCMVGNKKRWKGQILKNTYNGIDLCAELSKNEGELNIVNFKWTGDYNFNQILEIFGKVPLPPYINRDSISADKINYQTVYAINEGSVAAPTAGLHFTPEIFKQIKNKGIDIEHLTLHVGAGTFKPVTASTASQHIMHHEWLNISKNTIENLIKNIDKNIIAVGTTSVRALESIYWLGINIINNNKCQNFNISQWFPYHNDETKYSRKEVLGVILNYMDKNNLDSIIGTTELMIIPGYKFKMLDVMITNFHQPGSTLLMLVSAFIGERWKDVYKYALENNFRFLSYGDACLFFG